MNWSINFTQKLDLATIFKPKLLDKNIAKSLAL